MTNHHTKDYILYTPSDKSSPVNRLPVRSHKYNSTIN